MTTTTGRGMLFYLIDAESHKICTITQEQYQNSTCHRQAKLVSPLRLFLTLSTQDWESHVLPLLPGGDITTLNQPAQQVTPLLLKILDGLIASEVTWTDEIHALHAIMVRFGCLLEWTTWFPEANLRVERGRDYPEVVEDNATY